jgi:hypothetical protein
MRALVAAGILVATLFTATDAHARRTPSGPGHLDLLSDTWVHVGASGGYRGSLDYGRVEVAGRVSLLPWLALRLSHAGAMEHVQVSFVGQIYQYDQWVIEHAWFGPELSGAVSFDGWRLRAGASLETGIPSMTRADVEYLGFPEEEPSWVSGEWMVRGRAGVRVEGEPGFAQLEVVRQGRMETFAGVLDEPAQDPFQPPEYHEPTASAILASTFWRLDEHFAADVEASYDSDDVGLLAATFWVVGRDSLRAPANWYSVTVETGSDQFGLGLAVLRQW